MTPNIQKILVPTDFSPQSDAALDYAAALAAAMKAVVHLVHVVEEPFMGGDWELYVRDAQEIRERLDAEARSRLAATAGGVEARNVPVTAELRHGSAVDVIIYDAKAVGADLIVMGTHGRSGLSHLVLGSVAERVIRGAHCPVLAVRASEGAPQVAGAAEASAA
jgi:universal stress protein A